MIQFSGQCGSLTLALLSLLFVYSIHLVMVSGYQEVVASSVGALGWSNGHGGQRVTKVLQVRSLLWSKNGLGNNGAPEILQLRIQAKSCPSESGYSPFCTSLCCHFPPFFLPLFPFLSLL